VNGEPIDRGGPVRPEWVDNWAREVRHQVRGSFRADVAKACLVALLGREDLDDYDPDGLADDAVRYADALILRLEGGPR